MVSSVSGVAPWRADALVMGQYIPPRVEGCLPPRPQVSRFGGAGHSPLLSNAAGAPASAAFEATADKAIKSLPDFVQKAFEGKGYRVVIGKFLTDAFPPLKGQVPRGWDPWTTWDNSDAVCASPEVGLAEYSWSSTVQKPSKFTKMHLLPRALRVMPEVSKPNNVLVKNMNTEFVFRHEAGHLTDEMLNNLSATDSFEKAYAKDVATMGTSRRDEYYYYIQPDDQGKPTNAGRSEAFAEAFAALYGGGCNDLAHFKKGFKNLMKYTEDAMKQLQAGMTATASKSA